MRHDQDLQLKLPAYAPTHACARCGASSESNDPSDMNTPIGGMIAATRPDIAPQETKLLLTVEEAAQQLSIGRPKMYQLVMRGEVRSFKIGALRRIPVTALEAYVTRLSAQADAAWIAKEISTERLATSMRPGGRT
jgi:excisionase family DNA binding protein